ncbi:MAG TPA: DUF3108 domain-containing protein [Mucilaginibacter sp.]|nr:DUF3108 domain-containing protein [Mucilaginibacter sp.]
MKRYFFVILFAAGRLSSAYAQEFTKVATSFQPGENLSYKVKYGFVTGAEATIRVEDSQLKFEGQPVYHIIAEGKTAGTFDIFYKVRSRYESYVDENTLLPYFYAENRHESSYRHSDNVTFNHINNTIKAGKGMFPFKGNVFDFVSAYYFARCIDVTKLKIGEKLDMQYFLDDGVHVMSITYMGKERVKCSMGTFNCLKFSPTIIPGRIFRKDSKLYLWVTDDNNRIPVKAHVEVIVGSLTMDLTAASGLKYPLNPVSKDTD